MKWNLTHLKFTVFLSCVLWFLEIYIFHKEQFLLTFHFWNPHYEKSKHLTPQLSLAIKALTSLRSIILSLESLDQYPIPWCFRQEVDRGVFYQKILDKNRKETRTDSILVSLAPLSAKEGLDSLAFFRNTYLLSKAIIC